MDKKYVMVRAMHSSQTDFDIFFNNSVVAVGWSEIDFSKFDKDGIEHLLSSVEEAYYNSKDILPHNSILQFYKACNRGRPNLA